VVWSSLCCKYDELPQNCDSPLCCVVLGLTLTSDQKKFRSPSSELSSRHDSGEHESGGLGRGVEGLVYESLFTE
jgi:hypothetical protein